MGFSWLLGKTEPLGVSKVKNRILYAYKKRSLFRSSLFLSPAFDTLTFSMVSSKPLEFKGPKSNVRASRIRHVAIAPQHSGIYMTLLDKKDDGTLLLARSTDKGEHWDIVERNNLPKDWGVVVADYHHLNNLTLFYGKNEVRVGFSKDGVEWYLPKNILLSPREEHFDAGNIRVVSAASTREGILLVYESIEKKEKETILRVGSALISADHPDHVLWRSDAPLLELIHRAKERPEGIGALIFDNVVGYYVKTSDGNIATYFLPFPAKGDTGFAVRAGLVKFEGNPIVEPRHDNHWEQAAAFNPTAAEIDGEVHILYRAMSHDGISYIGHAMSKDGFTIHERSEKPAYVPREHFEGAVTPFGEYRPGSGGGYGGCEDPKMVVIDGRVYITYVAFNGTWPERTAISYIDLDDFKARRWNKWSKPALLSPDIIGSKSACILPEKVNGKYVIFHRVWPDILVDYVDSLDFSSDDKWLHCTPCVYPWRDGKKVRVRKGTWPNIETIETEFDRENDLIKSDYWKGLTKDTNRISARPDNWDSHKISMGSSPVRTPDGWLAIYSAVDRRDFSRYKIGAMLLDLEKPHKVVARSPEPLIVPSRWYENEGKPGIVYPGGHVLKDDKLLVYYGGADRVVCAASAPIEQLLKHLKGEATHSFHLTPLPKAVLNF